MGTRDEHAESACAAVVQIIGQLPAQRIPQRDGPPTEAPTSTTGSPLCSVTPAAQMAMSLTVRELLSRPGQAAGQRVE